MPFPKPTPTPLVFATVVATVGGLLGGCYWDNPQVSEATATTTGGYSTSSVVVGSSTSASTGAEATATTGAGGTTTSLAATGSSTGASDSTGDAQTPIMVDVSDPQLYRFEFTAAEADPAATQALGNQRAFLDTRAEPRGELVVYLHGAGAPDNCGSDDMGEVLAGMGFHVFAPCYVSNYGVGNCDDDIGGCRLEAFEGVDHHDFIAIAPADAIEPRVVQGLLHLQALHPGGDWQWFLADGQPRWNVIVVSGISHGASSSGVISQVRAVRRAVMLSGPLDRDQAWLQAEMPATPVERLFGFTHTDDNQHPGHLEAFADLGLPGEPVVVDGGAPPYGDSHRLVTSEASSNGHVATQAGGASPRVDGQWVYLPVWETMYGATYQLGQ